MPSSYGVAIYGQAIYGQSISNLRLSVPLFEADAIDHGKIRVRWRDPVGDDDWDRLRIVSSTTGWSHDVDEGTTLVDLPPGSTTGMVIEDVVPGRFGYYGLFVQQFGVWMLLATTSALSTQDHGGRHTLYDVLPETYHRSDEPLGYPLRRFLEGVGLQADHIRTELDSLLNVHNPDLVAAGLLPALAQMLGVPFEERMSSARVRQLVASAIYIYKRKGSKLGTEALATAVTGWASEVTYDHDIGKVRIKLYPDRINWMPNPSFELSADGWSSNLAAEIERVEGGWSGDWSLRIHATAHEEELVIFAPSMVDFNYAIYGLARYGAYVYSPEGEGGADTALLPFVFSQSDPYYLYFLQARIVGTAERTAVLTLHWYDEDDVPIKSASGSLVIPVGDHEDPDDYGRIVAQGVSPDGARYMSASLIIPATESGEEFWVDGFSIERSYELPEYFDAETHAGNALWADAPHGSPSMLFFQRSLRTQHLERLLPDYLPHGMEWEIEYALPEHDGTA